MQKSEQINELAAALAKAQGEIESAKKGSVNPHFKSRYADLADVWDAVRGPLTKHGLSVIQPVVNNSLQTILLHSSGQWISSEMPLLMTRQDMQGLGSAITYARRYALAAMVGCPQDDDDAEIAQGRGKMESKPEGSSDKEKPAQSNPRAPGAISEAQIKRLHAIRHKAGVNDASLKDMAKEMGIESSASMTREQYDALCSRLEGMIQ